MPALSLTSEHRWVCPNCPVQTVTRDEALPHHTCRGLRGLWAPMQPDGIRCQVKAVEREDYVGGELVQVDGNGRPVAAIRTDRFDGSNDVRILAPCAQVGVGARFR